MYLLIGLIALIGVPIAEIAVLISVGGQIGVIATIALILITAIAGVFLLRLQGLQILMQAQEAMAQNRLPLDSVIHGLFLLIAGAFLLTPGFITDALGFLLLVPPLRLLIARWIWARMERSNSAGFVQFEEFSGTRPPGYGAEKDGVDVIEGEFSIDDAKPGAGDPASPWRDKNE